ncbi:hypothetical protein [Streptomyces sp. DHE17-7]|nr:hypothetical protein [Streptomyces sp. DHE17-7]MBJ6618628.1 hypothetical protein [Streptomyces sp. DHE17-7]
MSVASRDASSTSLHPQPSLVTTAGHGVRRTRIDHLQLQPVSFELL